jgi:hypothetical protein
LIDEKRIMWRSRAPRANAIAALQNVGAKIESGNQKVPTSLQPPLASPVVLDVAERAPAATAGWSNPSSPTTRIATGALAHRPCLTVELCGTFVERATWAAVVRALDDSLYVLSLTVPAIDCFTGS